MQIGFMNTSFVDRIIRYKADLLAVFVLLAVGTIYIENYYGLSQIDWFYGKNAFLSNFNRIFIFLLCGLI